MGQLADPQSVSGLPVIDAELAPFRGARVARARKTVNHRWDRGDLAQRI
jgi:hypothetical protein